MPPAIRQQFRAWQRQWRKSGKTLRLLDNGGNRVTFQVLASDADVVDPAALLGEDPRELTVVEALAGGLGVDVDYAGFTPLPDSVRSGSIVDDELGGKQKVVKRRDNDCDFSTKLWLIKIVPGIDK